MGGGVASKPVKDRSVEIIAAGYSRTGSASMQLALERLLDGPVFHGGTLFLQRNDDFARMMVECLRAHRTGDKQKALKHLRCMTSGYAAVTDYPTCSMLPEMLELYPDAKVVLHTRDPARWWDSINGVYQCVGVWYFRIATCLTPTLRWGADITYEIQADGRVLLENSGETPGPRRMKYLLGTCCRLGFADANLGILEEHHKRVISQVPEDSLLIMDVKDGWEPLCKFLGKPVPDEPFPCINDSAAVGRMAAKFGRKVLLTWVGVFSVTAIGVYAGLWLVRK